MKKVALAWLLYWLSPVLLAAWDVALQALMDGPPRGCLDSRMVLVYGVMLVLFVWGTTEVRGMWGTLLRIMLVLGQLWLAVVLGLFLRPIQVELDGYIERDLAAIYSLVGP